MKLNYKNINRTLVYVGLESYEARYSKQLLEWNTREFDRLGVKYTVIKGDESQQTGVITTGQVLDAHGRSIWALQQVVKLVQGLAAHTIGGEDVIFFEDMFHPGIEALLYIKNQTPAKNFPKVYVRCLAQTLDPDDFVNVCGMTDWMRHFEQIVCELADGILVASEEMVAFMRIANMKPKQIVVTGLPFNKEEVKSWLPNSPAFHSRPMRVVFAARTDAEKQPDFYLSVAEHYKTKYDANTEFAILSGSPLRSNSPDILKDIKRAEKSGLITVYQNLKKPEYYGHLANARVLFNCALQDWVSATVSDADTMGANVVYPAYRSFPEAFNNDHTRLYIPWSVEDACAKLYDALQSPSPKSGDISDHQNGTIERSLAYMLLDLQINVHWSRDTAQAPDHYRMRMRHRS